MWNTRSRAAHAQSHKALVPSLVLAGALVAQALGQPDEFSEDRELVPADASSMDRLGTAVAIYNDITAVGAPDDDDNGTDSGSVYVYQASTGALLYKFVPPEAEPGDQFGQSVSIIGNLLAVGAPGDDDQGTDAGAVYLFNLATGEQNDKVLPDTTSAGARFGQTLAVVYNELAVAAPHDDDIGPDTGSVSMFKTTITYNVYHATLESKLVSPDGATGDRFGASLSFGGEYYDASIAIGAPLHDGNAADSGSVYFYHNLSWTNPDWQYVTQLHPDDPAPGDQFGASIARGAQRFIVGAPFDDDNAVDSGSVYVFLGADDFRQLAKLHLSNPAPDSHFGSSVALDGNTVAVGSERDAPGALGSGSAYLFDLPSYQQFAQLSSSNAFSIDHFGGPIAADNGTVIVGTPLGDTSGPDSGSAAVFSPFTDTQTKKVIQSDPEYGDNFGHSVDLDNNILAVGAQWDDDNGHKSGSAYLYNASTSVQIAKLLPADGAAYDEFGISIDLDNGIVAVGAWGDDDDGSGTGSVYLFDAITGVQIRKVLPESLTGSGEFGHSVSMDSGVLAVGATASDNNGTNSGSVYLFDIATGAQLARLLPSDGASGDRFGTAVSMQSGVVAIGAPGNDDRGTNSGSAYLFDVVTGLQIRKLLPTDGETEDQFGTSIALDCGTVGVGSTLNQDPGIPRTIFNSNSTGSAYLFDSQSGAQIAKLVTRDSTSYARFGKSIDIDDGVVAVGAHLDDTIASPDSGAAFLFDASTGDPIVRLLPSDGGTASWFGLSIVLDNGTIAAGAPTNGTGVGAAYLFAVSSTDCPADTNNDGVLDNGDINTFIALFLAGDLAADMNADGILDNGDIGVFITLFLAGC